MAKILTIVVVNRHNNIMYTYYICQNKSKNTKRQENENDKRFGETSELYIILILL